MIFLQQLLLFHICFPVGIPSESNRCPFRLFPKVVTERRGRNEFREQEFPVGI